MQNSSSQYSIRLFHKTRTISAQNALLSIVAAAIVLRTLSALLLGNTVVELPGIWDQISYDRLAQRVAGGYGFSFAETHWPMTRAGEPTAHWSFLYTLYLAGIYSLLGHQPVVARVIQAVVVGGLQTYLIYLIAKRIFSTQIGLIAAAISAFYIYFVYYGGALMTEPFYITAILWSLWLALRIAESESQKDVIRLGVLLGIALGLTLLLRQVFLLFVPCLFAWIWIARFRRRLSLPILSTALTIVVVSACILPISFYNQARFGRFVLLNTNSGYAFFLGNHPVYGTHFIPILPPETYRSLIPEELHHLDEAALDQALLQRGIAIVLDDPVRYFLLSLSRIPAYFVFWPSSESGWVSNISRVASFGIALPFMIYGMFLSLNRRSPGDVNRILNLVASPSGLLLLFSVIYATVHLLTWALVRYRLPIDAVLIPFAALGVSRAAEGFGVKPELVVAETTSTID